MAEIESYNFPDELFYHKEHAYAKLEDDGTVLVGMTDFAQKSAGEIAYVDLPFEGDEVGENETLGKIQTAKWVGKLLAPVSGEVLAINEKVEENPEVINNDPYGEGWIVKMQPSNWEEESKVLYRTNTPEMKEWMDKEIERVKKEMEEAGE